MRQQAYGVAAAIALGVLQLRTDLGAALAEPDELDWRQLLVDTGTRR